MTPDLTSLITPAAVGLLAVTLAVWKLIDIASWAAAHVPVH